MIEHPASLRRRDAQFSGNYAKSYDRSPHCRTASQRLVFPPFLMYGDQTSGVARRHYDKFKSYFSMSISTEPSVSKLMASAVSGV